MSPDQQPSGARSSGADVASGTDMALARAQCNDPKATWAEIIKETFPLRSHFRVAFDEDIWGPVLAGLYGFATVKSGVAHAKVIEECQA